MANARQPALRRRVFVRGGGAVAAVASFGGLGLLARRQARAEASAELLADPNGILDLPAGFSYRVVDRVHDAMDDGYRVPGRPDAMACFAGDDGTFVLMRNHELQAGDLAIAPQAPGQDPPREAFDAKSVGGVTRVVFDAQTYTPRSRNLVLAGTERNCAGGLSPWGWLSCEESVAPGHGYVFLCSPWSPTVAVAQPILSYGRFFHEAAVVDPKTHVAYLTEDRPDGAFYRFVPFERESPFAGRLEALVVVGRPGFDTGRLRVQDRVEVAFVEVTGVDSPDDTLRVEARAKGAAIVRRGEGLWLAPEGVYFTATIGGPGELGQLFRFVPQGDGGTLEVVLEGGAGNEVEMPDNLTVAPFGEVFFCEDGFVGHDLLWRLGTDGVAVPFARNRKSTSELAGVCFSPDGRALFVNLQEDGLTLMVTGPFPEAVPGSETGTGATETRGAEGSTDETAGTGGGTGHTSQGSTTSLETGTRTGRTGAETTPGGDLWFAEPTVSCACEASSASSRRGALVTFLASSVGAAAHGRRSSCARGPSEMACRDP